MSIFSRIMRTLLRLTLFFSLVLACGCFTKPAKNSYSNLPETLKHSARYLGGAVAFAPAGKYVAQARGKSVELIDPLSEKILNKLVFRESAPLSLAFSPDDHYLAIGTYRKLYIWNIDKRRIAKVIDAHKDGVTQLAFSSQGDILASGSKGTDRDIKFWKRDEWQHIRSFDMGEDYKYTNNVQAMVFSPDDRYFASAGLDSKIRVWSVETGIKVSTIENRSRVNTLAFSGESNIIASGDDDGRLKLWNVEDGMNIRTVQSDTAPITAVSFSKTGDYLGSASAESRVLRLWNTSSWKYERETLVAASEGRVVFDQGTLTAVAFNSAGALSLYSLTGKEFSPGSGFSPGGIPPIISVLTPQSLSETDKESVELSGQVKGASKIEKIEVYVNGKILAENSRDLSLIPTDDKTIPFAYLVALTKEGKNKIEIFARDTGGLESKEVLYITKSSERGQVWGAVIGVSEYSDPSINDLKYAASDAQAFYSYLKDDFGIPEKNLFALYDEKATIKNIRNLLGVKLKNRARRKDTVIIYYAGHGAPELESSVEYEDGVEKYFLPHDSDPKSLYSTAFPMKEVEKIVGRIRAERIAFIADTCFSGTSDIRPGRAIVTSQRTRSLSAKEYFSWASKGKGRVVLTASDANERSIEDDTLKHGLFTYYLLEALKGAADTDGDGLITVDEAYKYTSIKVADASNQEQNPTRKGDMRGQIILGKVNILEKGGLKR